MSPEGKKMLELMFRPKETICVSNNQFGFHSLPIETAISDKVPLVSPNANMPISYVKGSDLTLVALNPIKGFRLDENCIKFRNILVELDSGPIDQQINHIRAINLPFSASIFSGNKSVHFLISLDQDFPNEEMYRMFAQWILKAVPLADQKTFNPSRSIRMPGAYREPNKKQRLIEFKGPVKMKDLVDWLQKHPDAKPKKGSLREKSKEFSFDHLRPWVRKRLINGLDKRKGRSNQWYAIGFEFCLAGYSYEDTVDILGGFFEPERDFKEKEWLTTIKSAFASVDKKR